MDAKGSAGALHVVELLRYVFKGYGQDDKDVYYATEITYSERLRYGAMPSQKPSHKVVLISILDHVFQTPFYIKKKKLEIATNYIHYFCQSVFSLNNILFLGRIMRLLGAKMVPCQA